MPGEVQPQSAPFDTARISGARIVAISTVPNQSIERGRVGSRDSSIERNVTGMQTAAIAASIQNRPCQPVESTSIPPTSGPAAAPTADAAPHSETALRRSAPLEATVSRLSPEARIVEPAAPWMQRPRITPVCVSDRAISTQEAMNSSRPPMKILRRPNTSPNAPDVTMNAAPTNEYPVTAHCSVLTEALTSSAIAGSRIVTADVLALTTSVETHVATITPMPAGMPACSVDSIAPVMCPRVASRTIRRVRPYSRGPANSLVA